MSDEQRLPTPAEVEAMARRLEQAFAIRSDPLTMDPVTDESAAMLRALGRERDVLQLAVRDDAKWAQELEAANQTAQNLREYLSAVTHERDELARQVAMLQKAATLETHKLITCGVAASHPDPNLSRREKDYGGKWDSPQAQQVRALRERAERAESTLAAADVALVAAQAENARLRKAMKRAVALCDEDSRGPCNVLLDALDAAIAPERQEK